MQEILGAATKIGLLFVLLTSFSACTQLNRNSPPELPPQVAAINPEKTTTSAANTPQNTSTPLEELKKEYTKLQKQTQTLETQLSELQFKQEQQQETFKKVQKQWETNFSLMEHSVSQSLRESQQQLDVLQQISLNQLKTTEDTPSQKKEDSPPTSQSGIPLKQTPKSRILSIPPVVLVPKKEIKSEQPSVVLAPKKEKKAPVLKKVPPKAALVKVSTQKKPLTIQSPRSTSPKKVTLAPKKSPLKSRTKAVEIAAPALIAAPKIRQKAQTQVQAKPKKKETIETYSLFPKKFPKKVPVPKIAAPSFRSPKEDLYVLNSQDAPEDPLPLRPPPEKRILDERKKRPLSQRKSVIPLAPPVPLPEETNFNDPDLRPPKMPRQVKRRSGVKRMYNRGMAAIILQDYKEAVKVFKQFTDQFPDDINSDNAFFWIGQAYYKLGKSDEAEQAFRSVLKNYEHHSTSQGYKTPDAIYMLGKVYEARQDIARSSYYFREVIDQYPSSAAARNALKDMRRFRP